MYKSYCSMIDPPSSEGGWKSRVMSLAVTELRVGAGGLEGMLAAKT